MQFGAPIGAFQLTQEKLANMAVELAKGQLLALHFGRLKDQGKLAPEHVSIAKLNSTREALEICRTARTILGGNGISYEFPIMRHMANLESVLTYEGTPGDAHPGHRPGPHRAQRLPQVTGLRRPLAGRGRAERLLPPQPAAGPKIWRVKLGRGPSRAARRRRGRRLARGGRGGLLRRAAGRVRALLFRCHRHRAERDDGDQRARSRTDIMPDRFTCGGARTGSPPLTWAGAPAGTKSIALVVDDADAPITPYVYWVVFDIGPGTSALLEGQLPPGRARRAARPATTTTTRRALGPAGTATGSPCTRSTRY